MKIENIYVVEYLYIYALLCLLNHLVYAYGNYFVIGILIEIVLMYVPIHTYTYILYILYHITTLSKQFK